MKQIPPPPPAGAVSQKTMLSGEKEEQKSNKAGSAQAERYSRKTMLSRKERRAETKQSSLRSGGVVSKK